MKHLGSINDTTIRVEGDGGAKTWPRGYKTFSCATQLSMKLSVLINTKMPTKVGIFIFIS